LIDQGFDDDGRHPGTLHVERVGSAGREVEDASARVWAAVVDLDDDRAAVVEVVTFAKEASGSDRCAAVAVTVSRISPLAVRLPTRSYQAAFPN